MKISWSNEELEASVRVYLEMLSYQKEGRPFVKKRYYESLSKQFGRTRSAYERRMQNISFVLSIQKREWVKGLLPLKNVGRNVAEEIERILLYIENQSSNTNVNDYYVKKEAFKVLNKVINKDNWEEAINDDIYKYNLFARKVRKGQPKFRKNLLKLYSEKCVITHCNVIEVLEAAHIINHSISGINQSVNGLLLRSDIHNLFDAGLIKINPNSYKIEIDKSLEETTYAQYHGKKIRNGVNGKYPDKKSLILKYDEK